MIRDGMVLQRNANDNIWESANQNHEISVSFMGKRYQTTADSNGEWSVTMDKFEAGGPYDDACSVQNGLACKRRKTGYWS